MTESSTSEIDNFNVAVRQLEVMLFIARDTDLQRSALKEIEELSNSVKTLKKEAVIDGSERLSNVFLGCESVLRFLHSELKMWVLLKEQKPEEAWNSLIDAQSAAMDAIRADEGFSHLTGHLDRLEEIERLVFPPQVFLSAGLIVGCRECSVCGCEYDDCPHLIGRPYRGEFCHCILKDVEVDHVSLVPQPANKRCRVTHFSAEGGKRNRMTWKIESESIEGVQSAEKSGPSVSGSILDNRDLVVPRQREN